MSTAVAYVVAHLSIGTNVLTTPYALAATPEPQTPGITSHPGLPAFEFAPIVVKITYSLRNPVDGVEFVLPTDAYPYVS